MPNFKLRKYLFNPTLGLIPLLLYFAFRSFLTDPTALFIAISTAIIGEISLQYFYKSQIFSFPYLILTLSFLFTLTIWLFTNNIGIQPNIYVIICEMAIITLIMVIRINKTYINIRFFRKKDAHEKLFLNDFFGSAKYVQYILITHLLCILLYLHLNTHEINIFMYSILPSILISTHIVYRILRQKIVTAKLRKEEWLPIVTERGEVTGKIAKSVSLQMKAKFLHPIVRVALICNDKIYLQTRDNNDILSPTKLDYPFEKYMLFEHEINLSARNCIYRTVGKELDTPTKFILKYMFENESTKRLVFLFILKVNDEHTIQRTHKMHGKFWTVKQIEESFKDEIFGECFELEFEYLKNTVLAQSVNNNIIKNPSFAIPDMN